MSDIRKGVVVIGGGVSGIQAALNLASAGMHVYIVEKKSAIGGFMSRLDRTFPTNDCSMCILSPQLVEVDRDKNIEIITDAEVIDVSGDNKNYIVKIRKRPRYVDFKKCIACGLCTKKCPISVPDEFNEGMSRRKAIYIMYPQAVPLKYSIDEKSCLHFKTGKCKMCVEACPVNAPNHNEKEKIIEVKATSIIVSHGFSTFRADKLGEYFRKNLRNVVTSVEFERMLSSTGPYAGKVLRPSDGKVPKSIGFIQCVGSRDRKRGESYCSSVCCMYAIKEAILSKENTGAENTIYYTDMRAFGKNFEDYYERAKKIGIEFIRCRASFIYPKGEKIEVIYRDNSNKLRKKEHDLIVLSVGICPSEDVKKIASVLDIDVNKYSFIDVDGFDMISTKKEGIYACGTCTSPKDIPDSIVESLAASALSIEPGDIEEECAEVECDVSQQPRIGVIICSCGVNIGNTVDIEDVANYAKKHPNVIHSFTSTYACSSETQKKISDAIKRYNLNRIVVASCTPRTHEKLFQDVLRSSKLNPYLFELVNIREHCSWVHSMSKDEATEKAKNLVKMGIARAMNLEPLVPIKIPVEKKALIIGGGVAGMSSALSLSRMGIKCYIIEKNEKLGGNALKIVNTFGVEDVKKEVEKMIENVENDENIEVMKCAELKSVEGFIGNFKSTILHNGKLKKVMHGVIIVSVGVKEHRPSSYFYGENNVMTLMDFYQNIENISEKNIVFVQCVESREDVRNYCSRVCCTSAITSALTYKMKKKDANIFILYRDIRTYGFREELYEDARKEGIIFIRYDKEKKPHVIRTGDKYKIIIHDKILGRDIAINADLLVLSTGMDPCEDIEKISKMLRIPTDVNGFFMEAHPKLRPLDSPTEGIFLCGSGRGPSSLTESIVQGRGAAARAATILKRKNIYVEPIIAEVNSDKCVGCGTCIEVCSYGAVRKNDDGKAEVIDALCKGCGICASSCPMRAISIRHFRDVQFEKIIESVDRKFPSIVAFLCNWCAYAGADMAGVSRMEYPSGIRVVRSMCTGRIDPIYILKAFEQGVDGVLVAGCYPGECHYKDGNLHAKYKIEVLKKVLKKCGIEPRRLRLEWISASEGEKFADIVKNFTNEIVKMGENPLKNRVSEKFEAAEISASLFRLRLISSKIKKLTEIGNVYGDIIKREDLDEYLDKLIDEELVRGAILKCLSEREMTVKDISQRTGISTDLIFRHIVRFWQKQYVVPVGKSGNSLIFGLVEEVI